MIDSVISQTYKDWELCLADGSDAEHEYVGNICLEYAKGDKRIIYKKLEKNETFTEDNSKVNENRGRVINTRASNINIDKYNRSISFN